MHKNIKLKVCLHFYLILAVFVSVAVASKPFTFICPYETAALLGHYFISSPYYVDPPATVVVENVDPLPINLPMVINGRVEWIITWDDSCTVYTITLKAGESEYCQFRVHVFPCRLGDANADGIVNAGDVIYLINFLYRSGPPPLPFYLCADISIDGVVDSGDVICLINYLYREGPLPCQ